MPNHDLAGLIPILATPFHTTGELDVRSLRSLTAFQLRSGVDGVAVFGMASEAFALTRAERKTILHEVVDIVNDEVPIVAGILATSTITAVEQAHEAVDGGAFALMVLPPFLVKPHPAQLVDFYGTVAYEAGRDVMVQDAPGATGVAMSIPLIAELSRLEGVTSIKIESPPTAAKVRDVIEAASRGFRVFGGQNSQMLIEEYTAGAAGTMPACEFPDLLRNVLTAWESGEKGEAQTLFTWLLPLILLGVQPGLAWAVHKEALVMRGIIASATVRSPASALDNQTRASLRQILTKLELLAPRESP